MKRIAWFAATVFFTLTVVALLWRFHLQVALFILAVLIAAAVRPAVTYLTEHGLPPVVSLLSVYIIGIIIVITMFSLLGVAFSHELQQGTNNLVAAYGALLQRWQAQNGPLQGLAAQLPPADQLLAAGGEAAAHAALGATASFFDMAANLAIVLVVSIYWGIDYARLERMWLSLMPAEQHVRARLIWQDIETAVGAYIRSEAVQLFLAIVLLQIGFVVLGLHYPTALAVIAGLAWLIPLAGALLALIPIILVGLSQGVLFAIVVTAYTVAVLCFLEFVVQPRLVRLPRASSVLIVIFLLALSDLLGLIGLIIAPAVAVATQMLLQRLLPVAPVARLEPQASTMELSKKIKEEAREDCRHRWSQLARGGKST